MELLANIGCIIDFDGFFVDKQFLVKEMGFAHMFKDVIGSQTFKVGKFWNLKPDQRISARYAMKNIHGMKFEDNKFDLLQEDLHLVVRRIANMCKTEHGSDSIIAFKGGGCVEKDVLIDCEIPFVDLKILSRPKFKNLYNGNQYNVRCDLHKNIRDGVLVEF